MLFKHKHLLEDLRANGRRATGQILSMTTMGSGGSMMALFRPDEDLTTEWTDCRMKLRVVPADHSAPFEATVMTRVHTLKFQGGSVPVWYDPADPSRVVVDYEADAQQKMQGLADLDRMVHRNDQIVGRAWTPIAGTLLPIEVMARKGKGRIHPSGRFGALLTDAAREAVAAVRTGNLVHGLDPGWWGVHDLEIDEAYGAVPPGATAADGADAALAVAAALVSLLGGHLVRTEVAVTGRIAGGALQPVADLAGKVNTAKHGYAQRLVAPAGNSGDQYRHGSVEMVFAPTLPEALAGALAKHAIKDYRPPV
jgi:hypothetical protein